MHAYRKIIYLLYNNSRQQSVGVEVSIRVFRCICSCASSSSVPRRPENVVKEHKTRATLVWGGLLLAILGCEYRYICCLCYLYSWRVDCTGVCAVHVCEGVDDQSINTQPREILIAFSPPLNGGIFGASVPHRAVR